jgi:outer membrane receptor for ferrienterochelin and colicins
MILDRISAFIYKFCFFTITFIISQSILSAQQETVSITCVIYSEDSSAIPSVRIAIPSLKRQVFSDIKGEFTFDKIPKGNYKVNFSRIGFLTIDTTFDLNTSRNIRLVMKETDIITKDIVITGTRTYKHIENLPMPVEVVSASEIKDQGYLRLDEVLSQEMGIPMTENRGRGMQIQGLDADYTLVLLNGEPMSGRTGGVLNISRFSIANLSRVEVVRGPSSSLYGSSALAGVVNLITEKPTKPLALGVSGRYGSHNTYDVAGDVQFSALDKKMGVRVFADNYRTEGFSLIPTAVEKTVPENQNWTISSEIFYDFTHEARSRFGGRYNSESIDNSYNIIVSKDTNLINTAVRNSETNLNLQLNHHVSNRYSLDARFYASDYKTETRDTYDETGMLYDLYKFEHKTGKAEVQSTSLFGLHQLTGGFGFQYDQVKSDRVDDGAQNTKLFFGYLQDDWQLSEDFNVIGSLRYDSHSEYKDNLSPKIAGTWHALPDLYLRASLGSGFKAPTFEQLYLNWSLASEGYTVVGIKNFHKEFKKLSETGQIVDTLISMDKISDLAPEISWAIDFGGTYTFEDLFELKLNLFRNNINGLIEFLPVGIKSNGRLIYTYFNVNRIFTQGSEARLTFFPLNFMNIQFHYQFLMSGDLDVLDSLDNPKQLTYWKRDGNRDRRVKPEEYDGLFNRSAHSGSVIFNFNFDEIELSASLRGTFKSDYGFADINGNTILDDESEFAPGYSLWHFMINKKLFKNFSLQGGINNIMNYKTNNTRLVTSGRTFYLGINFNYIID